MTGDRELTAILADDHAIVREGIAAFLKPRLSVRVVAHCSEGEEALREILEQAPDFAILDFHLPKLRVLELISRIRAAGRTTRLIVLLTSNDPAAVSALFQFGASACLLKDGPASDLLTAIEVSMDGQLFQAEALRTAPGSEEQTADPATLLSQREYEVFSRLAQGIRPRDIAKELQISAKTVDTYRSNILKKLQVDGVAGLIRFAIRHKSTPPTMSAG